ncbi:glycoside hydrolase family 130 protein [Chitinophaga sp. Cy-1792]|uniref:glycoside hydrolase family 130 protein n=1 Tax=Chitinophaga sp. Cy-1792 TaxID=2608339 RepID=UPI00142192BF|nr:glycoside hydrolase family 130 protein [Chitinophaga sp. Cy-1792]NIG56633.1 glycosidase [Chitinophaga sp. Cy-1792]
MPDLATRFPANPLLKPGDITASMPGLKVACLLNPGVFSFNGKTWLIVRVAERPEQSKIHVSFPVLQPDGKMMIREILLNDPDLIATDARVINYQGVDFLTTLSHLRLFSSDDGIHFKEDPDYPAIYGTGSLETFGIEDCRVSFLEGTYYLTYTAVSENGVAVGMKTTTDWKNYHSAGLIFPPHNKDCAIFEERVNGSYYAFHRPSSPTLGGNYIWLASSPDSIHWGQHQCIAKSRPGMWDSARVGAGAAPIKTAHGWLAIYHGADAMHRYCLGALLLDLQDPAKVLSRSHLPIMEPGAAYELTGFFGHVVFTNGHLVNGDQLTIYYGAADEYVCGASFSIQEILNTLD